MSFIETYDQPDRTIYNLVIPLSLKRAVITWVGISLFLLILAGRIFNIFTFRQLSTNKLFPNYLFGEWVVTSSLPEISYNDVVCFKIAPEHHVELSRLLALEGDSVEVKDGYVLRNGFLVDDPENIVLSYFTRKEIKDLNAFKWLKVSPIQIVDTVIFNLTYTEFKQVSRQYLLRLYRPGQNNFPVLIVPQGYCLVGGDNRSKSSDNPDQELVPLKNMVGRVIRLHP